MDHQFESLKEQLVIHRRNITDLENQKAQYGLEVPLHVKRELEKEEDEIIRLEKNIKNLSKSLINELNNIRERIVSVLKNYIQISSQVCEFENMFLSYVLLPGFQLHQTVQKRKYLEREYNRIREAINRDIYSNAEEIVKDIRQTLKHAEIAYAYKESDHADESENLKSMSPTGGIEPFQTEVSISEKEKTKIIKEFKRTVLPRVHSDTSDAPFEVFQTVYEVYKKRDYLLMQGFIIQYRGELHHNSQDVIAFMELLHEYSVEYSNVLERIEQRLEHLEEDATIKKLENPDEVRIQMKKQNKEIRKAVYDEAEQILHIRNCLEELIRMDFPNQGVNES